MTVILDNFLDETMIVLPGGTELIRRFRDTEKWLSSDYRMSIPGRGKNQEQTTESVEIQSFKIARYPVTNRLYHLIAGTETPDHAMELLPKVDITWHDSIQFCNRISRHFGLEEFYIIQGSDGTGISINPESKGFRLPTDAEWQYACRAGSKSFQYSDIDVIAWHKRNSDGRLHNTGEKEPNGWKLYDMLGNIWEWTWDLYNQDTYPSYRIFRGGSFAEEPGICGATTRRKSHPDFAIDDLGFRLAMNL